MKVVYANESFPEIVQNSIFLAGPTPRTSDVSSWRHRALDFLNKAGYQGHVFVPEAKSGECFPDYENQIVWENTALNRSDTIVFWVPRDMETMPALTTNIEFGEWFKSGKVVFGAPPESPHCRYLRFKAKENLVPQFDSLENTLAYAKEFLSGNDTLRTGGECQVPLHIWRTNSFQKWYKSQLAADNRLDGAKVEWTFLVGPKKNIVFFWILHVNVYITSEKRNKTNEVVIARPDISTVVMYHPGNTIFNTDIILIREFRSPATTLDGFVWEVPGGSSFKPTGNHLQLAADEVYEETGLVVELERIKIHNTRQLVATLSAHEAHVFSVEITTAELSWLKDQVGIAHGVIEDTERTFVRVRTVKEILQENLVDWSMVGMILSVLQK